LMLFNAQGRLGRDYELGDMLLLTGELWLHDSVYLDRETLRYMPYSYLKKW